MFCCTDSVSNMLLLQKTDSPAPREITESLTGFIREGFFRVDAFGKIVFVNEALVYMLCYSSADELSAASLASLFADEEAYLFFTEKIKAESCIIEHRFLFRKKTGQNFWGVITSKQAMRNGELVTETRVYDISDLVKAEEALRVSETKAEKLMMELDRFIYSASHDIRSPVSSIQGLINVMKLELKDENYIKLIELMSVSVNRLDRFVSDLTSFAENSKKEVNTIRIDFEKLLISLLNKFKDHPCLAKVTVTSEMEVDTPFSSDLFRVRLILNNIIKNALDFCDHNKSNRIVSIQISTYSGKAIIEIFDNGVGIATPHLDKVFDMFYRASSSSKGSGIGLYTAREAAIVLGGGITLSSLYAIGTSVRIELPNKLHS